MNPEYLKAILDYNPTTGVVVWKERPRTDFQVATKQRNWNKRYVGLEAGNIDPSNNRLRVSLGDSTYYLDQLLWYMIYNEQQPIYHINGWNIDNRLENLTPERKKCHPVTRYGPNETIYLTKDRYDRYVIQTHTHALSIHGSYKAAKTKMYELAETLQCGWEDLII